MRRMKRGQGPRLALRNPWPIAKKQLPALQIQKGKGNAGFVLRFAIPKVPSSFGLGTKACDHASRVSRSSLKELLSWRYKSPKVLRMSWHSRRPVNPASGLPISL